MYNCVSEPTLRVKKIKGLLQYFVLLKDISNNKEDKQKLGKSSCGFHIVNIWIVRLTLGLISLVDDNHVDNILKEFFFFFCMYTLYRL